MTTGKVFKVTIEDGQEVFTEIYSFDKTISYPDICIIDPWNI